LILAFGLLDASLVFSRGFVESRTADRYVIVKGIAERDVREKPALWPLRFASSWLAIRREVFYGL